MEFKAELSGICNSAAFCSCQEAMTFRVFFLSWKVLLLLSEARHGERSDPFERSERSAESQYENLVLIHHQPKSKRPNKLKKENLLGHCYNQEFEIPLSG